MKKLLITAGGTATAWHICNIIKEFYKEEIQIYICDINNRELVPAALLCDRYFKVPLAKEPNYYTYMYHLLVEEKIDIIMPLLPYELELFSSDNKELKAAGIITTAPSLLTINQLNDKENMFNFCQKYDIPTIDLVSFHQLDADKKYLMKPKIGFGSLDIRVCFGKEIKEEYYEHYIVQELCDTDGKVREVTAEIFNRNNGLKIMCRERIEIKSGVCTKMKVIRDDSMNDIIEKMVHAIECPTAFNVQFILDENAWKLMDVNLRLGAGTPLSTSAGFQLTRALLAVLLHYEIEEEWFNIDEQIKTVLRVYSEVKVY